MAVTLVQHPAVGKATGTGSVNAIWTQSTVSGNIAIAAYGQQAPAAQPTITPAANWNLIGTFQYVSTISVGLYYSTVVHTGTETWSSTSTNDGELQLCEFAGLTGWTLDQQVGAPSSATSATPTTTTTSTSTQAIELVVGTINSRNTTIPTSPTFGGGATLSTAAAFVNTPAASGNATAASNCVLAVIWGVASATGTMEFHETLGTARAYAGQIAGFYQAASLILPPQKSLIVPQSVNRSAVF